MDIFSSFLQFSGPSSLTNNKTKTFIDLIRNRWPDIVACQNNPPRTSLQVINNSYTNRFIADFSNITKQFFLDCQIPAEILIKILKLILDDTVEQHLEQILSIVYILNVLVFKYGLFLPQLQIYFNVSFIELYHIPTKLQKQIQALDEQLEGLHSAAPQDSALS